MSIASRIQEIETHIGDVYDTINYSYDTTGINKNIINIPKYLKKGYIDIINNGTDTLYDNMPKVSGIGSNLSLTPTYEAPIKINEIDGDTLQDNSPTPDTPVEIQSVTGLQNVNISNSDSSSSNTYEVNLGNIELNKIGDYQDSIKKSSGKNIITTYNYASSGYINYNYDNSKIGKTMTYSFIPNFSTTNATLYIRANTSISSYNVGTIATITNGTKVSVTFTLTDEQYNTIKNTTSGYIQVYKSGVSMDENSISNPMLEENSQATDYEPYGKVWYVEKQTRKLELAIADMDNSENYPGWKYQTQIYQDVYNGTSQNSLQYYTSYRTNIAEMNSWVNINFSNAESPLIFLSRGYWGNDHTQTYWKTNYPNLIVTMVYGIQTPEITEITNTELIEDLETLYTAKSQDGTTNISITSEDLEMILNVSALKSE